MKSKNMTLMVVAVGCGLVAAFLTARMSGSSGPEMVQVWVAKKELPVGTVLEPKEFENLLVQAPYPKASLPQDLVNDPEQLKGRKLTRTLKAGNFIATGDVSNGPGFDIPEGTYQFAIRVDQVNAVAGFINPGDKVDVILTEQQHNGKAKSGIILRDMLVVAVDTMARRAEGDGTGRSKVESVSLAVTAEQELVLAAAQKRGEVKLARRDPKNEDRSKVEPVVKIPGFDDEKKTEESPQSKIVEEPKVSIVVTKADIALNTLIDDANLQQLFTLKEIFAKDAPAKAVKDMASLRGKYVVKVLDAEQIVMATSLDDKKFEAAPPVQVVKEPTPMPTPMPAKPARKKFIQTIGSIHYLFVEVGPNDFRLVGPVSDIQNALKADENVAEPAADKKSAEPGQPEKKDDPKPMADRVTRHE